MIALARFCGFTIPHYLGEHDRHCYVLRLTFRDLSGDVRLDNGGGEERNVACKGEMESEREMEPCKLRCVRFLPCTQAIEMPGVKKLAEASMCNEYVSIQLVSG